MSKGFTNEDFINFRGTNIQSREAKFLIDIENQVKKEFTLNNDLKWSTMSMSYAVKDNRITASITFKFTIK